MRRIGIVAVARKLVVLMHRIWITQGYFIPDKEVLEGLLAAAAVEVVQAPEPVVGAEPLAGLEVAGGGAGRGQGQGEAPGRVEV